MSSREWWIFGAGMDVAGAIVGALFHSAFVVVWNLGWLAVAIYVIQKLEVKNGTQD